MQTVPSSSVQSAFEEQPFAQLMAIVLEQAVSPVVRFRQNRLFGHASGQLTQTPCLQLGAAPTGHEPHPIVPPQPSWIVPH